MKRTTGATHQDNGIDHALDFVRENDLVQEENSKPVVTSKGEKLLNELGESPQQSESNLDGGH
jgi:hypothetical protein